MPPKPQITVLNTVDMFALACRGAKRWGLYLSWDSEMPWEDLTQAAPYLADDWKFHIFLTDGQLPLLLESREEMVRLFELTVGDDGPTPTNPYNGPCRVFACICDPDGNLLSENT
jgi:hypothetical protein